MIVVVAVVRGVPVSVVDVVDVIAVWDRHVAAAVTMGVVGVLVRNVRRGLALVPVPLVVAVQVSVVDVVDMVAVRHHDVAAAIAVGVGVGRVLGMGGAGHRLSPRSRYSYQLIKT